MTKELKILSINFPFRTPWVVQERTLATPRALFDFDVVVIRPYLLVGLPQGGPFEVDRHGAFIRAQEEMTAKVGDIDRLLSQGGLLVVILDVFQHLTFSTGKHSYTSGGTLYTTSNYEFLDEHFFRCLANGTGNNVVIIGADPFAPVITESTVEWTAFITARPPYPLSDPFYFARNGVKSYIGGCVSLSAGNIVLLPNFKRLDEEGFFEACREYKYEREGTPVPSWCEAVALPGLPSANNKILTIDDALRKLEQTNREATRERDDLLAYKKLLYEKGKTQLEPIVLRALNQIGFKCTPSETISGSGFEIDGRTAAGSAPGILEIKGSKKVIPLDEYSPFIPKILADFKSKGFQSKGILVGNGLCETPAKDRIGAKIFAPHVLEAAKAQSVALVNSVELYWVVCGILAGEIKMVELEHIREKILNANGFASLAEHYRTPLVK
jgi:hypothetical protein